MLHSTRISTARSLPMRRTATANSARSQSSCCLSPQMPFNPRSVCIPLLKISWKSIVPSLHGHTASRSLGSSLPGCQHRSRIRESLLPCRWSGSPGLPAGSQSSQPVPADQQMIQRISPKEPFTSRNIIPFLCQRLTAFALLLYFYRGGNLSKNMYSELLNSTSATEAHLIIQTNTPYLSSTPRPVSSSAFYMSTARVLKEGEINKPDLIAQRSEEPVEDTSCLTLERNYVLQQ
ncbi:LOW QUALITY PROTEIN: hypothetical protein QYF61_025504 [Mycteria americana]|uniref:Uncharacterized protein n=1 Tax=Mycteria americana TaxID=33587 RepID=A0AAN7MRP0_MYCAM|nr:LOW QUALITY PROTEIN: hypothetical protein QYF61_025504 [Mycteria americana]